MRISFLVTVPAILLLSEAASGQPGRPGARGGPPPTNGMIERLNRMTPEQRERALGPLPADRREKVERRLERFNSLSPEEKQRLREEYQAFQSLPPEKQDAIRRSFRQFNDLPDDRRRPVRRELMYLRRLNEDERTARFESEAFRSRFNETERQLLQDLADSPGPRRGLDLQDYGTDGLLLCDTQRVSVDLDLGSVPIFGRSGLEINHSPAGAVEEHQVGAAFHQPPLRQADCNRKFAVELAGRKRSPRGSRGRTMRSQVLPQL